jgi:hypothetical protein
MSAPGEGWASFDHDQRRPAGRGLRSADRGRDAIRAVPTAADEESDE